jgi:hypothetical protein
MAVIQTLFSLSGARGFEADLALASKEIRKAVEQATQETAFAVRRRAIAEAKTFSDRGDLANSIASQGKGLSYRVGILDISLPWRGGHNTAHWNPWVYGVWYEYGFVTRKIHAHPFMRPAAEAEEAPHEQRIVAALDQSLRTAA